MLQGILMVQKCFRGHRARCQFYELKRGISILQSFIRCKNARNAYQLLVNRRRAASLIEKHLKKRIARRTLDDRHQAVIYLQSVIRGCLVRRKIYKMQKHECSNHDNIKVGKQRKNSNTKDSLEHVLVHSSVLEELQKRALKAEALLGEKEEENFELQQNLKRFETRWTEYEAKMKSMEETWKKQMASLQVSLAAAKKSLVTDDITTPPGKLDASPLLHYYDSDDTTSVETHTPEGSTPAKISNHTPDASVGKESNVGYNAVSHLVKEFEQRRQLFNDDARFVIEVKSGQSASTMNPDDELRKLKLRFVAWKKDYKAKLRDTKATLHKHGKKWWGMKATRGL